VTSLETRLQRLEDEHAILDTMHAYAHSIDDNLEAQFADCWAPDGRLYWLGVRPEPFVGPGEIGEAFRAHMHPTGVFHKHLTLEPRIVIDGDRASCHSYFAMVVDVPGEGPRLRSYGRYHDAFVRCPDGRWRFAQRRPEVEAKRP
jgi:hypothetical protein